MRAVVIGGLPLSSRTHHVIVVNKRGYEVDILGSYRQGQQRKARAAARRYNQRNSWWRRAVRRFRKVFRLGRGTFFLRPFTLSSEGMGELAHTEPERTQSNAKR